MRYTCFVFVLAMLIGCQSEQLDPTVNCSTYDLAITVESIVDATCSNADGAITVMATGGTGNYLFSLNGTEQADPTFSGLTSGNYTVTVSDGTCTQSVGANVDNEDGLTIENIVVSNSGCGTSNGTITVNVRDAVEPVSYSLNGGGAQSSNSFSNLAHGDYEVTVEDDNGCGTIQEIYVSSGISYSSSVASIIENDCASSSCHGGSQSPDLRNFDDIQDNANRIKATTQNGSMPPNTTLDQDEIDAIACWADDGAPNN